MTALSVRHFVSQATREVGFVPVLLVVLVAVDKFAPDTEAFDDGGAVVTGVDTADPPAPPVDGTVVTADIPALVDGTVEYWYCIF